MLSFVEERLDMGYDYGAMGGPEWRTDIVEYGSGYELRSPQWSDARGRWELGERRITRDHLDYLQAFFRARRGSGVAFRYRDWLDYRAESEPLAPAGKPTVQLTKTYSSAGVDQVRDITKPDDSEIAVTMERGGSAFTAFSLDTTTGIATLTADWQSTIDAVTQAAPAALTITGHGRSTGETLYVTGTGMSIDDTAHVITVVDADTITLDGTDTTGDPAYSGAGGTAARYVQPGETLAWSGRFDVPARFGTDSFNARFDAADESGAVVFFLSSLPVVEVRQ